MIAILIPLFAAVRDLFRRRSDLEAELLALRHQLLVLRRQHGKRRVPLHPADRVYWVVLSRLWPRWRDALLVVKPETVIAWHRRGFRWYWRWKSRTRRVGRPGTGRDVIDLIRSMHEANPLWGAPRIHGELLKLGIAVAESTVSKYLPAPSRPAPAQGWRTFLGNHLAEMLAVDFAVVPTIQGHLLFVFLVLSLVRRRVLHVNVTTCGFRTIVSSDFGIVITGFGIVIRGRYGIVITEFGMVITDSGIVITCFGNVITA